MSRFTIALSGLAEADASTFEAALTAIANPAWHLSEDARAWLLVVDIDTVWGHMDWLRATASGQLVVAFTKDEQVRGCDLVLRKPLKSSELAALLDEVENTANTDPAAGPAPAKARSPKPALAVSPSPAPVAKAKPVPAPAPKPASATPATTAPEPELPAPPVIAAPAPEPVRDLSLAQCLLAGQLVHPVSITDASGLELTLDPERGGYTGPAKLNPLKPLLDTKMSQARPLGAAAIEKMREAPALPLTRLLWFAALSATPGQLAPTLDEGARYHLTRWPQIEREFPRHFRIATAMMKEPGTLGDIASAANAPVADVIDFINAYSIAGYVSSNDEPGETSGGMFSRLRRPFSRESARE